MGSTCSGSITPLIFLFSQIFKKKGICYGHGTDFLVRSHWSLKTYFIRCIDNIILSNKKTKELIKKINHLNDEQLAIIPYGLYLDNYKIKKSKEELRKKLGIPLDEFIIISVGRHDPRKNFKLVIKAMKILKENHSYKKIKYILIGNGLETPSLKKLVIELELENDIIFLGAFSGMRKNEYIKASDVLVMPSIATNKFIEGFGIVFLEANFYNIPVVGTKSGGITEAIQHNKNGLLITGLNDLVNAFLYLYNHEEERKRMGEYGYNRVINYFSWDILINKYIDLFNKINK
jgi:phosphatidylinositol alpha-1,6-mannosyltransferase